MARIRHCGCERRTERYYLYSEEPIFKYLTLYILRECPHCKQTVYEWQGIHQNNEPTPMNRIKKKDHDAWDTKIKTHQIQGMRRVNSAATAEIKQDTAKVWLKVLRRYGVKAIPKRRRAYGCG